MELNHLTYPNISQKNSGKIFWWYDRHYKYPFVFIISKILIVLWPSTWKQT